MGIVDGARYCVSAVMAISSKSGSATTQFLGMTSGSLAQYNLALRNWSSGINSKLSNNTTEGTPVVGYAAKANLVSWESLHGPGDKVVPWGANALTEELTALKKVGGKASVSMFQSFVRKLIVSRIGAGSERCSAISMRSDE